MSQVREGKFFDITLTSNSKGRDIRYVLVEATTVGEALEAVTGWGVVENIRLTATQTIILKESK